MRVRHGCSGEVEPGRWAKLDIELDENDLLRLLLDAGIPASTVRVADAFRLLDAEAERLMLAKLASRHGYPQDQARQQIGDLLATQQQVLNKYPRNDHH